MLERLWHKRLAEKLRAFRAVRGYWPDRQIIEAAKSGIRQAVRAGLKPPTEH